MKYIVFIAFFVSDDKIRGLVAGVTVLSLLVIVMGAIIIRQCRTRKDAPKHTAAVQENVHTKRHLS